MNVCKIKEIISESTYTHIMAYVNMA